jgi:acetyl-CoA C-acetyltransferase
MDDAVIISAVRTPVGILGGSLGDVSAVNLGAVAIQETLNRANVDFGDVDEVLMGNVISAGLGQNPARQAAIAAKIPENVPSMTVNKVCGSGMKTAILAAQAVRLGDANIVVAGGMENMSQGPYVLSKARFGYRLGHSEILDSVVLDGLWCQLADCHMGVTAENVASRWEISRDAMDGFSYRSHMKATNAWEQGTFNDEIVPVHIPQRRGDPKVVDRDEHFRPDASIEQLGRLNPVFKREDGTVTAGNSSGINDGAAAVVVTTATEAQNRGVTPMGIIRGYASAGVDPAIMGIAPVSAIKKVLQRTGLTLADIDLVELNEAFAAQSLAVLKDLDLDPEIVNVNGGAVALGHPIGCSGTRIIVTLLHELQRRKAKFGLASLCIGGGMGIAMVLENPNAV